MNEQMQTSIDMTYNEQLHLKITGDGDITKDELRMRAFEALLTDMAMEFNADVSNRTSDDAEQLVRELLLEIGTFIQHGMQPLQADPDGTPFDAVRSALTRLEKQ